MNATISTQQNFNISESGINMINLCDSCGLATHNINLNKL